MLRTLIRRGSVKMTACCLVVTLVGCATHSAPRMARTDAQPLRSSAISSMAATPHQMTASGSTVRPASYATGGTAPGGGLPLGDLNSLSRRSSCYS